MSGLAELMGGGHKVLRPQGGCHSCPRKRRNFVPADDRDASVIVVGESPDLSSVGGDASGPGGRSGELLAETLREVGIRDFAYTTAIHCVPPEGRQPTDRELRACLGQYVAEEVRGYPIVVLAGNVASSTFYPGVRPDKLRGNAAFHPDYPGQRFFTTYSPGYAMRGREQRDRFEVQMRRLARVLREPYDTPWTLHTSGTLQAWSKFEAMLETGRVSLDFETSGIEPWDPGTRPISVAACVDESEAVFWHEDDPEWPDVLHAVAEFLDGRRNVVIGHNIGFDLVIGERRLPFETVARCKVIDTMALLYLARQDRQIGLKQAVSRYLDGYRFLVHAPHECEDVRALGAYNSEDVVRSLQLFERFWKDLGLKTRELFVKVTSPTSLALSRVSADGIAYDVEKAEELRDFLRERRREALAAWREEDPRYDPEGVHAGEGLREYVFGEGYLGLPPVTYTDSGMPQLDKDAIKALVRDHPDRASPLRHLLEIKKIEKQESTYVEPYVSGKHTGSDGRIHSSYTYTHTDTGRPSSYKPNLQNIPRPERDWPVNARDPFSASPGNVLLQWDFSQIELRIAVCLAGDEYGIEAYRQGSDLHAATALQLAKLAGREDWTKEDRQQAKPVNFALCVPTEGTEILTREGWKGWREVGPGDETLGLEGEELRWTRVVDKVVYEDEPLVRVENSRWSAITTPDHRWYGDKRVDDGRTRTNRPRVFTTSEMGKEYRIWRSRPFAGDGTCVLSADECALVGWLLTDGHLKWSEEGLGTSAAGGRRRGLLALIAQKGDNFADDVRALLDRVGCGYTEDVREDDVRIFRLRAQEMRDLLREARLEPDVQGTPEDFVLSLGADQLRAFVDAVKKAEGSKTYDLKVVSQNEGPVADAIELALFMSGWFVSRVNRKSYTGKTNVNLRAGNPNVTGQKIRKTSAGRGRVWCVTTESGSWVMRQNGQIMITGNCYGGQAGTLQRHAYSNYGIEFSDDDAEDYVRAFFRTYAALPPWHQAVIRELRRNRGWVESVVGHVAKYDDWDADSGMSRSAPGYNRARARREHAERSAINMTCQNPAAQITFRTMILAQQQVYDRPDLRREVRFVNTVYDSVMVDAPAERVAELHEIMLDSVARTEKWIEDWFVVPLVIDRSEGPDWGHLEEIE